MDPLAAAAGAIGLAVLGAVAGEYFKEVVLPWIGGVRERHRLHEVYLGDIHWTAIGRHRVRLDIARGGYRIKGTLTFIEGNAHKGKRYKITGNYFDGLVTFFFNPINLKSTSRGSGVFKRLEDGDLLSGMFCYLSQGRGEVDSIYCDLRPLEAWGRQPRASDMDAAPSTT